MAKSSLKPIIIVLISFNFIILIAPHLQNTQAQDLVINLIHPQNKWKPFAATILSQNQSDLSVLVEPDYKGKLWNRVYLPLKINSTTNKSVIFDLDYAMISNKGNASFFTEVRDNRTNEILWSDFLNNNTGGKFINQNFTLPSNIKNRPLEIRLVIGTNGSGEHALDVRRATLTVP